MANDAVRYIGLFEIGDLFLAKLNGQSAYGIFQVRDLRCPDDGSRHWLLL
jgi:hypothetical protein